MATTDDPSRILCDRCGRDCRATDEHPDFDEQTANPLEGHFLYEGCYGSTRADLDVWKAELCEDCVVAVRDFINAGRPDHPGGPARGRGVAVIENVAGQQLAFCRDHDIPTRLVLDDGTVWNNCVDPSRIDSDEYGRWLETRNRVMLPRWA